jgi:hypothetical protein
MARRASSDPGGPSPGSGVSVVQQPREEADEPWVTRLCQLADQECPYPFVGLLVDRVRDVVENLRRMLAKLQKDGLLSAVGLPEVA